MCLGHTLDLTHFHASDIHTRAHGLDSQFRSFDVGLSVDRANDRKGFFDNMSGRPIVTPEWTKCEIQTQVDRDATFIKFGIMTIGRGRVFVDNVSFETIAK